MHQSGRFSIMSAMRSSPQDGIQRTRLISSSVRCAQIGLVHGDEPLGRRPEDDRVLAAPAMGIGMARSPLL